MGFIFCWEEMDNKVNVKCEKWWYMPWRKVG